MTGNLPVDFLTWAPAIREAKARVRQQREAVARAQQRHH